MKQTITAILAAVLLLAFPSCQKEWVSSVERGVDTARINISEQLSQQFVITVYSNQEWSASVIQGSEWLSILDGTGKGLGFIHAVYGDNFEDNARIGKIEILASSGKKKIVNIIQSGNNETASSVPDELL